MRRAMELFGERFERVVFDQPRVGDDRVCDGAIPGAASNGRARHGLGRAAHGLACVSDPVARLRLEQAELRPHGVARAARDSALGTRDRERKIVRLDRYEDRAAAYLIELAAERSDPKCESIDLVRARARDANERDADQTLLARRDSRVAHAGRRASVGVERVVIVRRANLGGDGRTVGGPMRTILREHARAQFVQPRGYTDDLGKSRRFFEQDLREHGERVVAGEGVRAGDALEEDAAEREDIGARIDVTLAAHLLGGHVSQRAEHEARPRDRLAFVSARDTEIEKAHVVGSPTDQEKIDRLHVAMDDSALVRVPERFGGAHDHLDGFANGQAALLDPARDIFSFEPLECEKPLGRRNRPVRDIADDTGMRELAQHAGFGDEPFGLGG